MAKKEQVARAAEGVLEPGEIVEVATMATIGSLQLGRQAAIAAVSAIATAGLLSVTVTPKPQPVVLTTRRLLVLGLRNTLMEQADSKIRSQFPRAELGAKPARRIMLYHQVDLTDAEGRPVGRMRFSLFNGRDASSIANGLGPPPVPAVAKKK